VKGRRKSLPCDAVFQYYTVGEMFPESEKLSDVRANEISRV